MDHATVLAALQAAVGADRVVADADVLASLAVDQSAFTAAGRPLAAVRARSIDDVVGTLRVAHAHRIPVVTRGAGTGLSGGANAIDGGIVLSTAAMDAILDIDVARRTATVQCGVLNGDLAAAVAAHGLWYVPDPASRGISTIGGNIATNAGGSCCLKYGVTRDHVAALVAVLADGTVIRTGGVTRKDVAGYDLTRLLVGSEGTLAVVVEATLWLRPAPRPPSTLVAVFPSTEAAGRAVLAIVSSGDPSLVELMDRTTIRAVEAMAHMELDTDAGALLLVQSDTLASGADVVAFAEACKEEGATYTAHTDDPAEGEQLLQARRLALPALERQGAVLLDDIGVPVPAVPALIDAIDAIAARHGVVIGTFGHAGDGNLHPTVVFDPADAASEEAARAAFDELVRAALALGGTITGEHGVGVLKRSYLADHLGAAERALLVAVKAAFDPLGILNPGKAI